jgi:hypothetical protein
VRQQVNKKALTVIPRERDQTQCHNREYSCEAQANGDEQVRPCDGWVAEAISHDEPA